MKTTDTTIIGIKFCNTYGKKSNKFKYSFLIQTHIHDGNKTIYVTTKAFSNPKYKTTNSIRSLINKYLYHKIDGKLSSLNNQGHKTYRFKVTNVYNETNPLVEGSIPSCILHLGNIFLTPNISVYDTPIFTKGVKSKPKFKMETL